MDEREMEWWGDGKKEGLEEMEEPLSEDFNGKCTGQVVILELVGRFLLQLIPYKRIGNDRE